MGRDVRTDCRLMAGTGTTPTKTPGEVVWWDRNPLPGKESGLAETDVFYVGVAPPASLDPGLVEAVASVAARDVFGTRVILASKIPRIVGRYGSLQEAEAIAGKLRPLGLVAVVCGQTELCRPSPARFRGHTMKVGEGGITFWDRRGQSRLVEANSVLLVLRGTARTPVQTETAKTKTQLNLAATVVTGGIPITRKVVEKSSSESLKMEDFVRAFDRTSSEPVVEVFQNDFDYRCLGEKKGFSSQENINVIAGEFRRAFPGAVFDSRLTARFKADVPFATPEEETEINGKLIYLCLRAATPR